MRSSIDKLRWLLAKAVRVFGERRLGQLRSPEIAASRMTIPDGQRFEAREGTTRNAAAPRSAPSSRGREAAHPVLTSV